MKTRKPMFALGGVLLLGLAGIVNADTTPASTDVQAELSALRARVQELEGKQSDTWLNEKRAAEVKALVKEVLSDADTRASLADSAMTAGHNGKHFFLASEDGNFLMNISGTLQVRYIYNNRDEPGDESVDPDTGDVTFTPSDEDVSGFNVNRAKVRFDGHVVNPNWLYKVQLATDRNGGGVFTEVATIGYRAMDNLTVTAGRFKAPFLHEDMVDDEYQLAVDRSFVGTVFGSGYVEGIRADYDACDMCKLVVTVDDGNRSGNAGAAKDWSNNGSTDTDIALGGRADFKLAGDWKQNSDFSAWSGEEMGLFVGGAVRYDIANTGNTNENSKTFKWTVDASFEMAGLNAYGAFTGTQFHGDDADAIPHDIDAYGALGQVGYMVIPDKLEPFVRFDWLRIHDAAATSQQEIKTLTIGGNYYVSRHAAKFTLDVVLALDPVTGLAADNADLSELGMLPDASDKDNQVAIRAQFQLLF